MAGMLPGVECARRRRFHQSGAWSDSPTSMAPHTSTRRSSFCLYTSNHESLSSSSLLQRSLLCKAYPHEMLGGPAREAKQRLDERLGTQRKAEIKSKQNREEKLKSEAELQIEVYGTKKKSGSRRFSWSKLSRKASEEEDCAVCLESFKNGDTLIHLPCAHRFHTGCLEPWLENNAHCPCCRMTIISH